MGWEMFLPELLPQPLQSPGREGIPQTLPPGFISEVARVFLSLPGCQVVLDIFAIHRNQDVWEDPEVCYLCSRMRR